LLGRTIVAIDHVGSTSVPGLVAKPRIDVVVVARNRARLQQAVFRLEGIGYTNFGDRYKDGMWIVVNGDAAIRHRLYICLPNTSTLRDFMDFRDILRSQPKIAVQYADLKRKLAVTYAGDLDGYPRQNAASSTSI
jgi:GrpB-like predicted nucleotidyltransferase (UPF0157 family)